MTDLDRPRDDILDIIGKGVGPADLIDADRRGPLQRQRQIESEALPDTIYDILAEAAADIPDQLALHFFETGEKLTYRELLDAVDRLAGGLHAFGVRKGHHVGVMLNNLPSFPTTWLALGRLGAVVIPINIRYTPSEISYVLNDGDAEFLVIDGAYLPLLDDIDDLPQALTRDRIVVQGGGTGRDFDSLLADGDPDLVPSERADPDDLMNIQYTSGTTGFPKGCMLRHRYWVGTATVAARRDGVRCPHILAHQPYFYMDPQWMTLMAFLQRGTLFVANRPSASRFMDWVRAHRIHFCIFPEVVYRQPPDPRDGDNDLRRVAIYGVRKSVHEDLQQRFNVQAREAFGMTEIGSTLFVPLESTEMVGSGSCGIPVAFREVRVVDDNGEDVPQGEIGELVVRGPNILLGYYNKPEATADSFFGDWFRTGDLFRQDENGFLYIVGRKKDMIRRSSENIAAREVEAALMLMPEIDEAGVVPVPDETRGEEVKAYVVLAEGYEQSDAPPEKIIGHAREHLAVFKVPRYLEYRTDFPRTPSLKLKKGELIAEKTDLRTGSWDALERIWR
ncbi:MAG: class I adenylate-forming enzyme family protein [Rhodospirillaceae bacterium]|nr:class I adenylate-forming enzyme family protein [Rhodospirillaceae bacterium]